MILIHLIDNHLKKFICISEVHLECALVLDISVELRINSNTYEQRLPIAGVVVT